MSDISSAMANYSEIRKAFVKHKIKEAHTRYEGSGDSGYDSFDHYVMEDGTTRYPPECESRDEDDKSKPLKIMLKGINYSEYYYDKGVYKNRSSKRNVELSELIKEVTAALVDSEHGGWGNNEGGQGHVTVTMNSIFVHHEDNVTTIEVHEHEYFDNPIVLLSEVKT